MRTLAWRNLSKAKAFYDQGGKVIATGTLPYKSAEFGHDQDVAKTIEAMFPQARNEAGGRAVFLERPTPHTLRQTLDSMLDVYDVVKRCFLRCITILQYPSTSRLLMV